jgi:hypothetical protein
MTKNAANDQAVASARTKPTHFYKTQNSDCKNSFSNHGFFKYSKGDLLKKPQPKRMHNMKNISEISQELVLPLSISDMLEVKGGAARDDKRRQRPGGGTTTTTPSLIGGCRG